MKILFVSDYNAPYEGNFIKSIKLLNKRLKEDNSFMCYLFPQRVRDKEWLCDLKNIANNKIFYFKDDTLLNCMKVLKSIIDNEKIDVIYCHFCRHKTQVAVKLISKIKKVKLVSHFHNHCKHSKNVVKEMFYKMAYQFYKGDLNIGCSKSVMESMPFNSEKNDYVENAIDFSRLDNSRDMKLTNKKDDFVILMFGFDYYRKGVDLVIKAINNSKYKDKITLVISLSSNKDIVKNNIMNEFGQIPGYVRIVDSIDDIASYYHATNLFVSVAREEGFCYSLVEAVYCKNLILSSDIPGVPKDIPGEVIFEKENHEDLRKKIEYIIEDEEELSKQKDEAKKYVIQRYNINNWVDGIKERLETMNE